MNAIVKLFLQNGNHYIECDCGNPEHMLRFTVDADDKFIYVSTFLNQYLTWYQRIFVAIKYVFKIDSTDQFDCTILSQPQISQLKELLATIK